MEDGGLQCHQIRYAEAGEHLRHHDGMVDVRRGIIALPPLIPVLVGGEVEGVQELVFNGHVRFHAGS